MSSQRLSPTTTAAIALAGAMPLMLVVGGIFVRSLAVNDAEGAREYRSAPAIQSAMPALQPPFAEAKTPIAQPSAPAAGAAKETPPATELTTADTLPTAATAVPPQQVEPAAPVTEAKGTDSKINSTFSNRNTERSSAAGILSVEIDKDTYNTLTQLKADLESDAWQDAAKLVSSLSPHSALGLAPSINDRSLLTSLNVAVELAREDYPQLRRALSENFTALASVGVAAAIREGNLPAIELATVQFADTPAAANAHRWLGDWALAGGRFSRASIEYKRACQAQSSLEPELIPRIRLASAMLGRDAGAQHTTPVQFGEVTMSPVDFEALVAAMRSRGNGSLQTAASPAAHVPPPGEYEPRFRSEFAGPSGDRPQDDLGRKIAHFRVPWLDRQLATVVGGDVLYVSNRFQVAAYKLTTGERLWQSEKPPGAMQRAQEWGLIAMRPLVTADRVFVRLLYSPVPLLVCLDKSSGKLLWVAESREHEFLVSDPLVMDRQLVALSVVIGPDRQGKLKYTIFDPKTGEPLRSRDLLTLRSTWGARACCELAATEDGIAVVLGGAVASLSPAGDVRWLRTQSVASPADDPRWVSQMFQPPLVHEGHLYVAQPGVRTVECLAARTGRRQWSADLSDIVGLIGLSGDLLVLRTETGVQALQATDGTPRWQFAAGDLFSFQLVDDQRVLLASRVPVASETGRWQVQLTWLDATTGKSVASTSLAALASADPCVGPLVPFRDRVFLLFGHGQSDPVREIAELLPAKRGSQ